MNQDSRMPSRPISFGFAVALSISCAQVRTPPPPPPPAQNPVRDAVSQLRGNVKGPLAAAGIDPNAILITHEGNNLVYVPSVYRVREKVKTPVTWVSYDGSFTLGPRGPSPFEAPVQYVSTTVGASTAFVGTATVRDTVTAGEIYRYTVELHDGTATYTDPDCPPIIVEAPPTGGTDGGM